MNARPNNNQLITYYLRVGYLKDGIHHLLQIQQYPVNNTYNTLVGEPTLKNFDFQFALM